MSEHCCNNKRVFEERDRLRLLVMQLGVLTGTLRCPHCDKPHKDEEVATLGGRLWNTIPHAQHKCVADSDGPGCGKLFTFDTELLVAAVQARSSWLTAYAEQDAVRTVSLALKANKAAIQQHMREQEAKAVSPVEDGWFRRPKPRACPEGTCVYSPESAPIFDEDAARAILMRHPTDASAAQEIRTRWPRKQRTCLKCGATCIAYASKAHQHYLDEG